MGRPACASATTARMRTLLVGDSKAGIRILEYR